MVGRFFLPAFFIFIPDKSLSCGPASIQYNRGASLSLLKFADEVRIALDKDILDSHPQTPFLAK